MNQLERLNDVIENLEHALVDKKQFYEMLSIDHRGERKELFSREKYLEFMIDVALQKLWDIQEREEQKQNLKVIK